MKLRIWETMIISIGFVFLYECVETKLLTNTKTKKGASTNAGHKIITKRAFIQGRQNSPSIYVKHQSSKHKHHARSRKFKKRYISKSTVDVLKNKFASLRKSISRGSPTDSYTTGGGSELRRPVNLQKINQNTTYRRRKIIPDLLNAPTSFKRWDFQAPEEAEEGLDKRSRNRVKLNMQWPHFRQAKSHISEKHDILNKKTRVSNGVGAGKRQRISGGVVHMDGPPPSELVGGTPVEMPDAGMRMAENANGLILNSMAEMPKHAFHSSRFHAPAVHRFFPVEHRYDNSPIHKYLSSPVMLRAPHREGFPFADGGGGPFGGPPIASMFQGPPAPGHHVVIVNRPVKTPFPVPVQGPSRFVFVHHPVPMPPERVPVPVPVMVQRQGHQPIIIVHHKEYSGPVIDPCGVNPCRNGGTCSAVGSEFKCVCPVGYKSERCEVQSKCNPNPCKNFGKCTELSDDYECTCHTGFHGKSCDLESKCEPNPCRNGGVCTENVESYICSCSAGFMGKNCEQESKCLPVNPCKNSGVCTEDIGGYKCNCKDGYAGINCEVRETTSACDSNPCHNGATCIVETYDSSKFSCYCAHGYNGLDCLERSFSHLGLSSSPCGSVNPCLFGGHCVRNGGEYSCLCPDGRSGSHCEHFYQESVCDGCHHHAVCISSKCTCREGYTGDGKTCKPKTSHCHPNPCENGGSCHEDETAGPNDPEWWCECLKGYSGTHCHEYDPCASYKCHNGGKCETVNSEPRCRCEAPFEGPTCLDDNFCLPRDGVNRNPCKNGGKCEFVNSEVTCVCPIEYEGPRCNINKCDKCAKNAFCEKGICKCRPPYSGNGLDCELDQAAPPVESYTAPNYCDSNPCHNGATCVDGKATFYCACKEDTFGRLCEKSTAVKPTVSTPKAVCHPNPCLNGGMCKETGANQDFDCICPNARYKGRFCDVDMCAECDPHARCINGKCFCRKGFIGDGYSCKKEKPKCSGCPEFATCVGGNQCICNPGFSMGAPGKRACIPIVESLPVVQTVKHDHEAKAAIPVSEANPTARTGQWSEDIIVTEYRNLGCWSDTTDWRNPSQRALMVMEGLDPLLAGDYRTRKQPISKCADVAKRLGFRVFAIQNGGQCFGGSDDTSYKKYGQSEKCLNGVGGSLANDVYKL